MKNYFAFISYTHKDVFWAKWLLHKLEWYRLPSNIHNDIENTRYIRPIFRDRDELNAGILIDELSHPLHASKFLIVICSKNVVNSQWVSQEVQDFIDQGKVEQIILFCVEGNFPSNLPISLQQFIKAHPKQCPLAVQLYDDGEHNRQKAFIRIVSRLLGVSFDTLWKRRLRRIRATATFITTLLALLIGIIYWFATPLNLSLSLHDEICKLPKMEQGWLRVDNQVFPISTFDTIVTINDLPGYYRCQSISVHVTANRFYVPIDTTFRLHVARQQRAIISMRRDDSYAIFAGYVFDNAGECFIEQPINKVLITIENQQTYTDSSGYFSITFPIEKQTEIKPIMLTKDGYKSNIRQDETPSSHLRYIMHKSNVEQK